MQTQCRHRPGDLLDRTFRRERDAHRPLAPFEKLLQAHAVFVGFCEAEQFEIVAAKHYAIIGRTLPDVAATRGRNEAESRPAGTRAFEVAHRDNHMIDTSQAVTHGHPSWTPAKFQVYGSGDPEAMAPFRGGIGKAPLDG